MKNLILITLLAIICFGCSRKSDIDPDSSGKFSSMIVGKWHYSADTVKSYTDGKLTYTSNTGGVTPAYYFQYNADGTGIWGDGGGNIRSFTYSISGTILTIVNPAYSSGGVVITPALAQNATIRKLTNSNFNIYFDDIITDKGVKVETTQAAYFIKQ